MVKKLKRLLERMTFKQLLSYSEPGRVKRSQTVRGGPLKIESSEDESYHIFNFKSLPSTTGKRHHGYIKFIKPKSPRPLEELECFGPDTQVLMADGTYRAIKDVQVGELVYTHKGRKRRVTHKFSRPLRLGEKVYELKVEGFPGVMLVTENQPFYALRGPGECQCGCGKALPDITENRSYCVDRLGRRYIKGHGQNQTGILPAEFSTAGTVEAGRILPVKFDWIKAGDLKRREWLVTPWLEPGSRRLDPGLARFLGYYAAEGCLATRANFVRFSFHADEEKTIVKDLLSIADRLFSNGGIFRLSRKYRGRRGGISTVCRCDSLNFKRPMKAVAVTLAVTEDFKRFVRTHVGERSQCKRLSPWLMEHDNETLRQLVVGLFLGDGHLKKNGCFRWWSASKTLALQVSTILNRLRVRHVLTPVGGSFAVDINYPESCKEVYKWLLPYLRGAQKKRKPARRDNIRRIRPEGYLRTVKKFKRSTYSGEVWDLSVAGDRSFIAHGIAVHNCVVDCTCPDFRYRWAWAVKQRGSSQVGTQSLNQALNRAPRKTNPGAVPGLCKHLIHLKDYIFGLTSDSEFGGSSDPNQVLSKLVAYADKRWTGGAGQNELERTRRAREIQLRQNRGQPGFESVLSQRQRDWCDQALKLCEELEESARGKERRLFAKIRDFLTS